MPSGASEISTGHSSPYSPLWSMCTPQKFNTRTTGPSRRGLALYMVHWFYEIMNAVICAATGYALWTVSPESTSFVLLVGVSWELSMMFAVAGLIMSKLLPEDPKKKILGNQQPHTLRRRQRGILQRRGNLPRLHPRLHLGISLVGRYTGVYHHLHSVFPGGVPRAGQKAAHPENLHWRAGCGQRAASRRTDSLRRHLKLLTDCMGDQSLNASGVGAFLRPQRPSSFSSSFLWFSMS